MLVKEEYELDLETNGWALYRSSDAEPYAYLVAESTDINEIFIAMFRDKACRGNGSSMRIG